MSEDKENSGLSLGEVTPILEADFSSEDLSEIAQSIIEQKSSETEEITIALAKAINEELSGVFNKCKELLKKTADDATKKYLKSDSSKILPVKGSAAKKAEERLKALLEKYE